ncbi:Neurolysin [Tolypocladium capitatum]|uniref:Neurolysin n=1 Tax=Tolypocladium capitatum TaxID=45235 RepID=A0A2K3QLY4_9HYPO|nr:Neurolysin [Tolypocladium capitatum]
MIGPFVRPPAPNFNVTESDLTEQGFLTVKRLQNVLSAIVDNVALEDASFNNTIRALAQADNELNFDSVAPLSGIRKAASEAVREINRGYLSMFQHEKLFTLVDAVYDRVREEHLDYESKRLLDKIHTMFVDNGMKLKGDDRDQFDEITNRLIELRAAFIDSMASEPGTVWKSEQALAGLSRGKLESLDQDSDGNRRINFTRPDVTAVLRQCHVDETRREVFLRSQAVFPDNVPIFQEAMVLRDEAARLLGHTSFAAQRLEYKMAKTPEAVDKFLAELNGRLQPLIRAEIQTLQKLRNTREDSSFYFWDLEYYHQKLLKERRVDHEVISEYFPADYAIQQMMSVFQHLFSLSIEEMKGRADDAVWHPDVKMFAVWDSENAHFLAYLYIDIYPRPGKVNHAANFNIRPGYIDRDGSRVPVATSLICSLSPPSPDCPALLQHTEVITIFHELGNGELVADRLAHRQSLIETTGIHDILGKTQYAMFSGHRTVRDFVETPSQLLEYWCWSPETLQQLNCHYSYLSDSYRQAWCRLKCEADAKQPSKELPRELIAELIASKHVNQGILTSRLVALGMFDMQVHNPKSSGDLETTNIAKAYNSLLQEVTHLAGPKDGVSMGNGYATTSHFI